MVNSNDNVAQSGINAAKDIVRASEYPDGSLKMAYVIPLAFLTSFAENGK